MDRSVQMPGCMRHDKGIDMGGDIDNRRLFQSTSITAINGHLLAHDHIASQDIMSGENQCTYIDFQLIELGYFMTIRLPHPAGKICGYNARGGE